MKKPVERPWPSSSSIDVAKCSSMKAISIARFGNYRGKSPNGKASGASGLFRGGELVEETEREDDDDEDRQDVGAVDAQGVR